MTDRVHVPFDEAWRMQTEAARQPSGPRWRLQRHLRPMRPRLARSTLARRRAMAAGRGGDAAPAPPARAAGAPLASVRRLEAFYVGLANERALRAALVEAVGGEPDVLLVPLPYFYYPGMRIELDATCDTDDRLVFRTADGDDLRAALAALELPSTSIRALRIYRCADSGPIVAGIPLPQLPCRVRVAAIAAEVPPPDIIFVGARLPVDECGQVQHPSDVEAQTRLVMSRIGHQLRGQDASLADLVKVTVHYVGGPRPEDLHRNLDVRSQLYVPPGPASTGVPVPELQLPGETILIEAIAIRG